MVLYLFLLFQVLSWALRIAIVINANRNVTMITIIVIRSGFAAVVIMIVLWNAKGKAVNRRVILELTYVNWIWNVKVTIVIKPARLKNVSWTAEGKIVKHKGAKEMYVNWIYNVTIRIVNKSATLKYVSWTAAGKIVKHKSAWEMYVNWI